MCPPKCVLIVDDEPNVRLMLRTTLESTGYRVAEAADGLAALTQLREAAFDLVLLDLRMPNVDGISTLYRLRERGDATPVVMLTAHGSVPDAVTAMKLGAIDFLAKPVTPKDLRIVVSEVIRRNEDRSVGPQLPEAPPAAHPRSFGFELARAKRAINRGQFDDAERLLREVLGIDSDCRQAHELLDRLLTLKEREGAGSFRMLREWFPSGAGRTRH
jgi:DNA-binding response OmpR family regulator